MFPSKKVKISKNKPLRLKVLLLQKIENFFLQPRKPKNYLISEKLRWLQWLEYWLIQGCQPTNQKQNVTLPVLFY